MRQTVATGWMPWVLLLGITVVQAQDGTVYQCAKPGQPQLFTDAAGARQSRERGFECHPMPAVPVTVPQGPRSRGAGAPAHAAPAEPAPATAASGGGGARPGGGPPPPPRGPPARPPQPPPHPPPPAPPPTTPPSHGRPSSP